MRANLHLKKKKSGRGINDRTFFENLRKRGESHQRLIPQLTKRKKTLLIPEIFGWIIDHTDTVQAKNSKGFCRIGGVVAIAVDGV